MHCDGMDDSATIAVANQSAHWVAARRARWILAAQRAAVATAGCDAARGFGGTGPVLTASSCVARISIGPDSGSLRKLWPALSSMRGTRRVLLKKSR